MIEMTQGMHLYLSVLVFLLGACFGSFMNVCIFRIPREESVVAPPSHCPGCGTQIAWRDNLPILSFLLLRGRCRHCDMRISPRYVWVELVTAILILLVWLEYGLTWLTPVYGLFFFGLLLGTFVDLEHMIIPDRVSLGGIAIGLGLSFLVPALHGEEGRWIALLASGTGAAVGFGLLWLVSMLGKMAFKKDAMGFGDVKLIAAIGAFLGWQAVLFTIMVSSFLGSVVGIALILGKSKEWQSKIPYGPYLAAAAMIWVLWGSEWWTAYINWVAGG